MTEAQAHALELCEVGATLRIDWGVCDCGECTDESCDILVLAVDRENMLVTGMVLEEDPILGNIYAEGIALLRINTEGLYDSIDLNKTIEAHILKLKENKNVS